MKPEISQPGVGPHVIPAGGFYSLPPMPPLQHLGDMQTDQAKAMAQSERNTVGQRYNNANFAYGQDVTNYSTANAAWDAKRARMTQADRDECYGHLLAAYNAQADEQAKLTVAYGHIATGDQSFRYGNGDDTPPAPPAVQRTPLEWFQNDIQHLDIANDPNCVAAENDHTTFAGNLTQANTVLAKYP